MRGRNYNGRTSRDAAGVTRKVSARRVASLFAIAAALAMASVLMVPLAPDAYATLAFDKKFGENGTDDGDLNTPADLVLERNRVYVVDTDNHRISVLSSDGSFIRAFGSQGSGNAHFNQPVSIANIGNDLYILDSLNKRVKVVGDRGGFETAFGSQKLDKPTSIAINQATQRVFVSDSGTDKIHVFATDGGGHAYKYDISSFNGSAMSDPEGLAVDETNRYLYVADTGNHRIGIFMLLVEGNNCPTGMVREANGICYVGEFGQGTGNATFATPTGLAVDNARPPARGDLYVADTGNNQIQAFSFVSNDADCPSGTTSVVDNICFAGKIGSRGASDGKFDNPSGLAVDSANRLLYVADTDNSRIQVLKIGGSAAQSGGSGSSSSSSGSSGSSTTAPGSTTPNAPRATTAVPTSPDSILVTWTKPATGNPPLIISGYKVEYAERPAGSSSTTAFEVLVAKTDTNATSLHHTNLEPSTRYSYKVSAISDGGKTGRPGSTAIATPAATDAPTIVDAVALTPSQVKIAWLPPSNTYKQPITGYVIYEKIGSIEVEVGDVRRGENTYLHAVDTNEEVDLLVKAKFGESLSSPYSDVVELRAIESSDHSGVIEPHVAENVRTYEPTPPINARATAVSDTQIRVSWGIPTDTGNLDTSYIVEAKKKGSSDFESIADDVNELQYTHTGITPGSEYTYRVYATNSKGESDASNEVTAATRTIGLELASINPITITAGQTASFSASVSGDSAAGATFELSGGPTGAVIAPVTGSFTWNTSPEHGGETYLFDVVAKQGAHSDKTTVRIKVNNAPAPVREQPAVQAQPAAPPAEQAGPVLAGFVESGVDPQTYVDRYNSEPGYKQWFDDNYSQYDSIYHAVGLPEVPASFVESGVDPQTYVDRYNNEPGYKQWFDDNYSQYDSIYHAVGMEPPGERADESGAADPAPVSAGDQGVPPEPGVDDAKPSSEPDVSDVPPEPDADTAAEQRRELPRLDVPLAPFVEPGVDPQSYVDRYDNEPSYKQWFDENHAAEYGTIYRAVGLLDVPASFVESGVDPQTYVDRYNSEPGYKQWFDENYSEYLSIYHAVGLPEPGFDGQPPDEEEPEPKKVYGICGPGTKLVDGVCTIVADDE